MSCNALSFWLGPTLVHTVINKARVRIFCDSAGFVCVAHEDGDTTKARLIAFNGLPDQLVSVRERYKTKTLLERKAVAGQVKVTDMCLEIDPPIERVVCMLGNVLISSRF